MGSALPILAVCAATGLGVAAPAPEDAEAGAGPAPPEPARGGEEGGPLPGPAPSLRGVGRRGSLLDRDGGLVEPDVGGDDALPLAHRGKAAHLPLTGGGEEPELALGTGHHLGGELVGVVQQPDVGPGHGGSVVPDRSLDHRLRREVDPREGTALLRGSAHVSSLLDRDADERAVLDPAAVVVLDVGLAEQLAEHEPRVARPLADAAVGDGRLALVVALLGVELGQLLVALESAVLVGRLAP